MAATRKTAVSGSVTVVLAGGIVIVGGSGTGIGVTVRRATSLVTDPLLSVTMTSNSAPLSGDVRVEVSAARAVLVDRTAIGKERTPLVVKRRQRSQGNELEHCAEEVVRIRGTTRDGHHGRSLEDLRRANSIGRIRVG